MNSASDLDEICYKASHMVRYKSQNSLGPCSFPSSSLWLQDKNFHGIKVANIEWCCYITVDSALQNGACTSRCISEQVHYKTSFSHNGYMKSLEFIKTTSLCSAWKKTFFIFVPYRLLHLYLKLREAFLIHRWDKFQSWFHRLSP
jgi:hypothetical protein